MKFKITKDKMSGPYIMEIDTKGDLFMLWYKEQAKRFIKISMMQDKKERDKAHLTFPVYDVDEAMETGVMSLNHLIDFLKFNK